MYRQHIGVTLVEMVSVVAILGILLSSALPAVDRFYERQRLIGATEMVYRQLQLARSEAISRSRDVYLQFNIDGSDRWSLGMSTESTCNPEHGLQDELPCYLEIDDGDGVRTSADRVLQSISSRDYPGVRITSVTFGRDRAKFDYVRGTSKAGSVKLESASGYRTKVVTSVLGRIRLCSPRGEGHVSNYPGTNCRW